MIKTNYNAGNILRMKTDHPLHYDNGMKRLKENDNNSSSFADLLKGAVRKVNDLQVKSDKVTQKMIYEPESVDIHTVMITAQKAEIALNLAKSVRDEAIRSFRNLISLR